eukprot:jgi/Psemu1/57494/gm1.57494_g
MNVPVGFNDGENEEGYCELDSHADTTATGSNMILLNPDQVTTHVDVAPFSEEYKPIKKVPIGSCATAWTDPSTGKVYIIIFHQALYFGSKDCNFNSVEEAPCQFDHRSKHAITLQTPMEDDDPKKPTKLELDECDYLTATNDVPWDPHSLKFRMAELAIDSGNPISGDKISLASNVTDKLFKASNEIKHPNVRDHCKLARLHQVSTRQMLTECQIATDGNISHRISSITTTFQEANVSSTRKKDQFLYEDSEFEFNEVPEAKTEPIPCSQENDNPLERQSLDRRNQWGPMVTTIDGPNRMDCERLAKTWNVSFKKAEQTLKVTAQKALRNLQLPLMKRLPTQRFRNKRVAPGTWYTDTWHAKTTSIMRQEKCAQVFKNGTRYEEFIPILGKSQAHQELKTFIIIFLLNPIR